VTARHSVNQLSRAQLAQLGVGIGMIVSPELRQLGDLTNLGLNLLFLKYGRDDERQADELGFQYMLKHQYDVREMRDIFAALQSAQDLTGQSPIPSWLASHPSSPDRIAAVDERIAALGTSQQTDNVNAERYLDRLEGLVYGSNPRDGYFADGRFYHPELAFQFSVPESWRTENLPATVLAVDPNQAAALQLTLTDSNLRAATENFFGQSGAVNRASDRTEINGHDAIVSRFQAETPNGVVLGFVGHIAYGDITYRLTTFALESVYPSQERLFRQIVNSFAPLTDQHILDVKARRLQIVELDRAMTLEEFAQRYPSTNVSIEELAVINQVESASSIMERGTSAKRIVG
jgi:predicted Zn-dependent protease